MVISESLFIVDPDNKNNKKIFISFKNASYGEWCIKVIADGDKRKTKIICSVPNFLLGTNNSNIKIKKETQKFRVLNGRVCLSDVHPALSNEANTDIIKINHLHRLCKINTIYYKRILIGVIMTFHREYYDSEGRKGIRKRKHKVAPPMRFYPPINTIKR
ncbi:hypothetical protein [Photobacterium kishitanii]|uniref:Uncharacterized protein n=1 Tax=Photobacterium kishitanii TaxID=318456 RepID=A0A2T3KM56_9GAMM|nr:hypothetical protein [Photobacterium kishitanii]PSV00871.1 hypothetical protein C9J27_02260 [Photobacterium kishitanii]